MKTKYLLFFIFLFSACKSSNREVFEIDPRSFVNNKITLDEIADDINYIPLDKTYPIGLIYSYKFVNNSIFISSKDLGILVFNRDGKFLKRIGRIGRGPEEYLYCLSFTVDDEKETVYVMDKNNMIKEYSPNGNFIKRIRLPECEDGSNFRDVDFYNSSLFVSQFINMGLAKYNWIILDTIGNLIKYKMNSIPPFSSREGNTGGVFKFKNRISYWNLYNDTVFSILPDFSYKMSYLFTPGEHRMPKLKQGFKSVNEFFSKLDQCLQPELLFETTKFIIFKYYFDREMTIAVIEKKTHKSYLAYLESDLNGVGGNYNGGIINSIDGGTTFQPQAYLEENGREYLIGLIDPYQIKLIVADNSFKSFATKSPEKKKELVKLARNLEETDNPIFMIIRLKK